MVKLEDKVLSNMSFDRLKNHRRSVFAHINGKFWTTPCECCRGTPPEPIGHDTPEYAEVMEYRRKVNHYYFKAKAKND